MTTSNSEETSFLLQRKADLAARSSDSSLQQLAKQFFSSANQARYSYQFDWLSRPIIQYPQDIVAIQELIWSVKPDLIVETGVARGGSILLSASLLSLLDLADSQSEASGSFIVQPRRKVIGIDIDIRAHNRAALESSFLRPWFDLIEGSSVSAGVIEKVKRIAEDHSTVLVLLDSDHTHDHVLAELNSYANLTTMGSYCVVFDTVIEDLPSSAFPDRPWGPGNNPRTAVHEFLRSNKAFEIDRSIEAKLLLSVAPEGFLKRVK